MHPNFHFSTVQVLWTLTFAAQLVLLVVLLGRDRIKRFPWFTLSILLMALRLLASRLLYGRMPTITLSAIFVTLADVTAVVAFLVVVEMARRAFAPVRRSTWFAAAVLIVAVAGTALYFWGPWPAWKTLTADSPMATLQLMQLGAQKFDVLVDLLTIQLGVLVVLFGRRYGSGWRTHTQRIVIGLSTASIAQLAVQAVWQLITLHAVPHSQAEYERVLGLRDKLFNADGVLYIAVVVWWVACLWVDEPGAVAPAESEEKNTPHPEYITPEPEYKAEPEGESLTPNP
ncbi:MAG: hypothetical protein ABSG96_13060 [Terracidiphilus sp.]|jgi:hypothetical protein